MPVSKRTTRFLWIAVGFLVVIGIAAVTRRTLVLLWPVQFAGKASPAAALDTGFARHIALTFVHILPEDYFLSSHRCSSCPAFDKNICSCIAGWEES